MKTTLLRGKRLRMLVNTAKNLELEGAFVELGSWRGGSASAFIKNLNQERECWLFDSFEGLPEPTELDTIGGGNKHATEFKNLGMPDDDSKTYEICCDLMASLDYPQDKIHIIKGWFKDTFPIHVDSIDGIAVLHVDCDFYEPVKLSLDTFYDKVVPGGVIILDDYGHWDGAKKAVDEFLSERDLNVKLLPIDYTGHYFKKP